VGPRAGLNTARSEHVKATRKVCEILTNFKLNDEDSDYNELDEML
jgi:hypothetical protein